MIEFVVKGIRIKLSFLFFWFFALLLFIDKSGFVLMGFIAASIHELGHLLAFVLLNDLPTELSFEVAGIKMVRSQKIIPAWKSLVQLLAGSSLNFIFFFILLFSLHSVNRISVFATCHFMLGVFNLLPIRALDGGKIIQLLLDKIFSPRISVLVCTMISWGTLVLLIGICLYFFFVGTGNLSLFSICIWMGIVCCKKESL